MSDALSPATVRALSETLPPVEWPPRLDAVVHLNTGAAVSSWSADVRAIVDSRVAILVKRPAGTSGPGAYILMHDWEFRDRRVPLRYGALPRILSGGGT